jgi:hypothetical protein
VCCARASSRNQRATPPLACWTFRFGEMMLCAMRVAYGAFVER